MSVADKFDGSSDVTSSNATSSYSVKEILKTGHIYPRNPIVRVIDKRYKADAQSKSAAACNKYYDRYGKNSSGLFVVFCLDCNAVIGAHVMLFSESVRTVFRLVFTRWEVAPEVIVSDNCCNLSKFCMLREPDYFKDTFFMIDRLHASEQKL